MLTYDKAYFSNYYYTYSYHYYHYKQRCKEVEKARMVMERYVNCRPDQTGFLRLCKFEDYCVISYSIMIRYAIFFLLLLLSHFIML